MTETLQWITDGSVPPEGSGVKLVKTRRFGVIKGLYHNDWSSVGFDTSKTPVMRWHHDSTDRERYNSTIKDEVIAWADYPNGPEDAKGGKGQKP